MINITQILEEFNSQVNTESIKQTNEVSVNTQELKQN